MQAWISVQRERDGLNNEKNAFKMCSLKSHQTYGLNVGSYTKKNDFNDDHR